MSNKDYKQEKSRYNLEHDLYRMVRQERRPIMEAVAKFGVSRATGKPCNSLPDNV